MKRLFAPQSIVVVGASPSPGKIGNVLLRNLAKFPGRIYPVHPSASEVLGKRAYPTVAAIPEPVDLALLVIPPEAVLSSLRDCAAAKVGGAVIYSGGWAESGEAGSARQKEIQEFARAQGIRLLGPNTSGFITPHAGIYATFVADIPETISTGSLAIVAQSGGVNLTLCFLARNEGLGVRFGVGLGNSVDVGLADVLDYLREDKEIRAIALAVEGVADGRALFEAVEKTTEKIPVIALKLGRSDVTEFAKSHTGALTGSYRVTRAALAQAGAVVVDNLTELLDAARALGAARLTPKADPGVGVITGQAGPGLLLADALGARGVRVPLLPQTTLDQLSKLLPPITYQKNPVDTGRPGPSFREVLQAVRHSPGIDLLALSLIHEPDAVDPGKALEGLGPAVLASQGPLDVITPLRDRLYQEGIALFSTPDRAALSVSALAKDSQQQWLRNISREQSSATKIPGYKPANGIWDEDSAKNLIESLGIPTPQRLICANRAEAYAAWEKLPKPLAVKMLHPEVLHKTEAEGVHLHVQDRVSLDTALSTIDRKKGSRYLIEVMANQGPELLLGARRDVSFGPIVVLGSGGIGAEAEEDLSVRLAPLSKMQAKEMLGELQSAWRYRGYRGGPVVNEEDLSKILVALGSLIVQRTDIAEIEINPLRVTTQGLVALDALVITK